MEADAPALSDEELLDRCQCAAFGYFIDNVAPGNGLVADTSRPDASASIAVVGFALSCYPIGVERGWMERDDAIARTLSALRFFWHSRQSDAPDATGFKGFYYHFLHMETGRRASQSELSLIDTTFLLAGMLTAAAFFDQDTPDEREIGLLTEALYRRVDWQWGCGGAITARHGWKPESGFLHYGWEGYSEATLLYVLGLASPTFPLPADSFAAWTTTYQWETIYDVEFLYAGPLFVHHYSHAWIDFRGIQDGFMREKECDYFENSRRATLVQRDYASRNPLSFRGYGKDCWGLTANDGPGDRLLTKDGEHHRTFGYVARGVPYGPDDGTISPPGIAASLPFSPKMTLDALRHLRRHYPELSRDWRLPSGFNPTLPGVGPAGWISDGYFGLDQGIVVLMIENHRSELIWRLTRRCPAIINGLRRAGFAGAWLS
jgi:hypothetical protein